MQLLGQRVELKHLARLEVPVLIAGNKPHDLVDHRLRLVVLDKTHDGLLHDGDAVLDCIAPAVHDAPSDGDALVARRIGERVAFLPVLRPFQHVGLHVEDLPEIVKHLLLDRADVAAQLPEHREGLFDLLVHHLTVNLAVLPGLVGCRLPFLLGFECRVLRRFLGGHLYCFHFVVVHCCNV